MTMSEEWSWISENLPRLWLVLHPVISTPLFHLENLSILQLPHNAGQISLAEDRKAIQGALQKMNSEFRGLTGVYNDVFFKGESYVFQWNEMYVLLIGLIANLPDDPVLEPLVRDSWISGINNLEVGWIHLSKRTSASVADCESIRCQAQASRQWLKRCIGSGLNLEESGGMKPA